MVGEDHTGDGVVLSDFRNQGRIKSYFFIHFRKIKKKKRR